jgi:hypothetical protein
MENTTNEALSEEKTVGPEVSEATVVDVENVEKVESSDITPAETEQKAKKDASAIDEEHKKYLLERAKESNINWDEIEFEDAEKQIPLLTDEDRNLFVTISEGYFDRDLLNMYIDESMGTIEQYLQIKSIVDSGEADEADMAYYEELSKGFQDAKIVLASIQVESRALAKSFKESKVSEDFIKAIALKSLHDFLVKRFKYTDTWKNHSKHYSEAELADIDRTKLIEENIFKKMYITTMFNEYIHRYNVKQNFDTDKALNVLSVDFMDIGLSMLINAIEAHIKCVKDQTNIDLASIIDRDFKYMECVKAPILYALLKHDHSIGKMSKDGELLVSKLNPNGVFDSEFDTLYETYKTFVKAITNESTLKNILSDYEHMITTDPLFRIIGPEIGVDKFNDYKLMITAISNHIPDIEGTKIREWAKWYKYMRKFENYYSIYTLANSTKPEGFNDQIGDESVVIYEKLVFNVIMGISKEIYDYIYSEMIIDVSEFIKMSLMDRSVRPFLFEVVMNNLSLQHHLGFISTLKIGGEDDNTKGDKLYEFAKEQMGEKQYEYFIVDKESDILLKDVDLVETRRAYIQFTTEVLNTVNSGIMKYTSDAYKVIPENSKTNSKKKKRHNRRH